MVRNEQLNLNNQACNLRKKIFKKLNQKIGKLKDQIKDLRIIILELKVMKH